MSSDAPQLSVVVPCFNEELVLAALHQRLSDVCRAQGVDYEVVLVNDGSRDGTWPMMEALAAADPHLVCVNLSRNHGHQLALTAGLQLCRGQRVLVIDADLQDPPELLPAMMARMDAGVDVVYGQRRSRQGESRFKLLTAKTFYRLLEWLTDVPIPRDTGDFRLISRRALDVLLAMPERSRFLRGMVSWIGFRQEPLLYDRAARLAGETKYPFFKMFRFAVDAITSFSLKPLTLATWVGFGSGACALLLCAYAVIGWLLGHTVTGWTSLMAVVTLLASLQFLVLGVFGEYLGRLCAESKGRPLFIVERVVGGPAAERPAAPRRAA
jgi:glycosyltransferase involved in cell wall biosynthesis